MNIIIDDYIIEQDDYQYILKQKVQRRKVGEGTMQNPLGESYDGTEDLSYHIRMENAVEEIIRLNLAKKKDNTTLQGFIREFKAERERINNILK